jgi:hypothetical protein
MLTSRIHRRKPKGAPMPEATARANAKKSSIRARVEHVFAHQKTRFGLWSAPLGLDRLSGFQLTGAGLSEEESQCQDTAVSPDVV